MFEWISRLYVHIMFQFDFDLVRNLGKTFCLAWVVFKRWHYFQFSLLVSYMVNYEEFLFWFRLFKWNLEYFFLRLCQSSFSFSFIKQKFISDIIESYYFFRRKFFFKLLKWYKRLFLKVKWKYVVLFIFVLIILRDLIIKIIFLNIFLCFYISGFKYLHKVVNFELIDKQRFIFFEQFWFNRKKYLCKSVDPFLNFLYSYDSHLNKKK